MRVGSKNITEYITDQMLDCVIKNGIYPQDVQYSKTIWIQFGSVGLTVSRAYAKKTVEKHLNGWKAMTANEINRALDAASWIQAD